VQECDLAEFGAARSDDLPPTRQAAVGEVGVQRRPDFLTARQWLSPGGAQVTAYVHSRCQPRRNAFAGEQLC
jgi:hypothetical protein